MPVEIILEAGTPGASRKRINTECQLATTKDGTGSSVAGTRIGRISDDRPDVGRRNARRTVGIYRKV